MTERERVDVERVFTKDPVGVIEGVIEIAPPGARHGARGAASSDTLDVGGPGQTLDEHFDRIERPLTEQVHSNEAAV